MRRRLLAVACLVTLAIAHPALRAQEDPYALALKATTRAELPTAPVLGWSAIETGIGYPEPRGPIEAQGHLGAGYDLNHARHIHVLCPTQRAITGSALIECRLRFFHAEGFRLTGVHVTWRGGAVDVLTPSPAKDASSPLDGIYDDLIDEPIEDRYVPIKLTTTRDVADGKRAFELDVKGRMTDGRSDNTRLLGGCIEVRNGRDTRKDVSCAVGAEYWLSNTATQTATGYIHAEIRNPRRFDMDQYALTATLIAKGTNDPARQLKLLATINPNLHMLPDADHGMPLMYGYPLWPRPFDPETTIGEDAPRKVSVSTAADGTVKTSIKWLPQVVSQPTMVVGDREMFRVADPGVAADGTILRPEGAFASLIVVTLGKGQ